MACEGHGKGAAIGERLDLGHDGVERCLVARVPVDRVEARRITGRVVGLGQNFELELSGEPLGHGGRRTMA
jgi:hypothetical protein